MGVLRPCLAGTSMTGAACRPSRTVSRCVAIAATPPAGWSPAGNPTGGPRDSAAPAAVLHWTVVTGSVRSTCWAANLVDSVGISGCTCVVGFPLAFLHRRPSLLDARNVIAVPMFRSRCVRCVMPSLPIRTSDCRCAWSNRPAQACSRPITLNICRHCTSTRARHCAKAAAITDPCSRACRSG